ncbi:MAG: oligosaccharide flippase family protein [Bacteroidales bacterium]
MTGKFTRSIVFAIFLNLLIKPFWIFVIDRKVQNLVGTEEYGMYFSLLGFTLLFNIIADFGTTSFNNRIIAQNHNNLTRQFIELVPLRIILAIVYCFFTLAIALIAGYSGRQIYLVAWLIFNQVLVSLTLFLRSNISGLQLFNTDSIVSVIDKLLLIIFCGILFIPSLQSLFRIEWFVYAQSAAYFLTFLITLFIVIRKTGHWKIKFNPVNLFKILNKSFPFALLMFLMMVYNRIDAVMLERILPDGKVQAGIYAQAFRINDALAMFAFLFAGILFPLFAKLVHEKKPLKDVLGQSFAMLIVPSAGIVASLFIYSPDIMSVLYHQHILDSSLLLKYLLFGFLGNCLVYIFGTLLTASNHLKILNFIALIGFITNLVLNIFLIPGYKVQGAAIAYMITQLLMGFLQLIVVFIVFRIKPNRILLLKYFSFILLLVIFSVLILRIHVGWQLAVPFIIFFTFITGIVLKLIKADNFYGLLNFKKD